MKKSVKKSKEPKAVMPDLVTAMIKLVERFEGLEKKTDMVLGRVSSLPAEVRQAIQNLQRPEPFRPSLPAQHHGNNPQPNQGIREKILFEATCADCLKSCKVPFRPSENRPVYCPECFAIRKAGHVPKDLTSNVVVPQHMREIKATLGGGGRSVAAPKGKKPTSKVVKKPARKKKK